MKKFAVVAVLLTACGFTPLSNQIEVGDEAYFIAVGEGPDGTTDLFAAPAEGGTFKQLTFTRLVEDLPRLADSGTRLAFIRKPSIPSEATAVTVMDLKRGTEVAADLPPDAGPVKRLGWLAGDSLVVVAEGGRWMTATSTPVLSWLPVEASRSATVDSLIGETLGGGFATIAPCTQGSGTCIRTAGGDESPLDARAIDPVTWGADAVGYVLDNRIEIRPLGGGRVRRPDYRSIPAKLRHPTFHPGAKR